MIQTNLIRARKGTRKEERASAHQLEPSYLERSAAMFEIFSKVLISFEHMFHQPSQSVTPETSQGGQYDLRGPPE